MITAKTLLAACAVFVLLSSGLANAIPHPAGRGDSSDERNISPLYDRAYASADVVLQGRTTAIDRHDSRKAKQSHSD